MDFSAGLSLVKPISKDDLMTRQNETEEVKTISFNHSALFANNGNVQVDPNDYIVENDFKSKP